MVQVGHGLGFVRIMLTSSPGILKQRREKHFGTFSVHVHFIVLELA